MEYLLKVSAVIVVFYGIYRLFLERDTFFEINRSFLLFGLILSFLLPLWTIPVYHEYTPQTVTTETIQDFTEIVPIGPMMVEEQFGVLEYLPYVYGIGVIGCMVLFLFRLITLLKACIKSKSYKQGIYTIIEAPNDISPFSFFNWIVYNPSQFNQTELEQIIAHEKIHAKQYHSIDILLMELCCVFLWFHPLVWLYNKSLKQNLEFLADKYALHQFENKKSYQYTLLKVSVSKHQMALSNHFYNPLIKKRIAMLQKTKSKKVNLLKYALIVPVLAMFLMSFNTQDIYVEQTQEEDVFEIFIEKNTSDNELDKYRTLFKNKFDKVLFFKDIQRNYNKTIKKITVEILFSNDSKFTTTQKYREGEIAIRDFIVKYDPINKTIDAGDAERVNHKEAQNYSDDKSMIVIEKVEGSLSKTIDELVENTLGYGKGSTPLYVVDNYLQNRQTILDIPNHQVKAIAIIKKEYIAERYGKGAVESGVVQILTTRGQKNLLQGYKIKKSTKASLPKDVIYYVDKKQVAKKEFEKINSKDIQSINVFKGKKAVDKYGEKGRNGVVEIMTEEKNDEFKMFLDKNTSDKTLQYYKKHYQEKLNKELNYKVKRNAKNEIIFFDFKFEDRGSIKTEIDKIDNEPIKNLIIIVTKGTNVLEIVEYGKDS